MNPTTTIMVVTPDWAREQLEKLGAAIQAGTAKQRNATDRRITQYAEDMRLGEWGLTHQGIAFDSKGILIDGQHRLAAVIRAGVPVTMMVTYGLESKSDSELEVMDMIDRGKARSVANQLQLHGYKNATSTASAMVSAARVYTGQEGTQLTMPQTMRMLHLFGHSVEQMFNIFPMARSRPTASTIGPLAVYHEARPQKARGFAQAMVSMSNLQAGSPVLALIKYRRDNPVALGGGRSAQYQGVLITCTCLRAYDSGDPIQALRPSEEARGWLAGLDKQAAKIVLGLFRPRTDRPQTKEEEE